MVNLSSASNLDRLESQKKLIKFYTFINVDKLQSEKYSVQWKISLNGNYSKTAQL